LLLSQADPSLLILLTAYSHFSSIVAFLRGNLPVLNGLNYLPSNVPCSYNAAKSSNYILDYLLFYFTPITLHIANAWRMNEAFFPIGK